MGKQAIFDINKTEAENIIQSYFEQLNFNLDPTDIKSCVDYLTYVLNENEHINVTAINEFKKATILHIIDSLLGLVVLDKAHIEVTKIIDLGTGGGFPGIPLGLCLKKHTTLIDSVNKKIELCNKFLAKHEITNIKGVHSRFEEISTGLNQSNDLVVSRAVDKLNILQEYARPYLCFNGYLLAYKSLTSNEEIQEADNSTKILGYELLNTYNFDLPYDLGTRELVLYKVVKPSSIKLPRQIGKAKRNPL